ncbi:MAG: threonine aldolase, partial [Hymenobacteraceae bacterium]|nr:threonine aldolase [Hymenobacteraceae bacterium]MDX5394611.1 threonine aldolase [Hymenobacteraceae bacterium]MDX5510643.1 threonine aldolase [Hymenobacteraceae bacterium]
HHVNRLSEDHQKAKQLEMQLHQCNFVEEVLPAETNIVICKLNSRFTDDAFVQKLNEHQIKASSFGPQMIRFVTHLDITDQMLEHTLSVLQKLNH